MDEFFRAESEQALMTAAAHALGGPSVRATDEQDALRPVNEVLCLPNATAMLVVSLNAMTWLCLERRFLDVRAIHTGGGNVELRGGEPPIKHRAVRGMVYVWLLRRMRWDGDVVLAGADLRVWREMASGFGVGQEIDPGDLAPGLAADILERRIPGSMALDRLLALGVWSMKSRSVEEHEIGGDRA